jgi:RsiW-degrading membrane proteinase PrsW (M82 family)
MALRPGGAMVQSPIPTRSQLIPLLSNWRHLRDKSQLGAMIVTVISIMLMYAYIGDTSPQIVQTGSDPRHWIYTSKFLIIVGLYLTFLSLYFVYRLAGKKKSWLAMLACFGFTAFYLWLFKVYGSFTFLYTFFHQGLAGGEPSPDMSFIQLFFRHFVGTGFFEEFVKAIPLLVLFYYTPRLQGINRENFGIEEPLDGILFGAASAGGFAVAETLLQYVPDILVRTWTVIGLQVSNVDLSHGIPVIKDPALAWKVIKIGLDLVGTGPGAQLLIPRSLDEAFGHMAYSGYLGYFIGLAALKPAYKWRTILVGYVSASLCHALWDSVHNSYLEVVIGVLCYAVLAAAILKSREISPNRFRLQPSVVFGAVAPASVNPAPQSPEKKGDVVDQPVFQAAAAAMHGDGIPVATANLAASAAAGFANGSPQLRIGTKMLIIVPGLKILEHQAPGLQPQSPGGPIAEVTCNPQHPSILGLTNLSSSPWKVVTGSGNQRQVQTGQTVKLSPGTKIDFGVLDGEVQ